MPNNKYGIAGIVFLSTKFTIDTIKKHIEASKKYIHLIFSFFMIFFTSVKFKFVPLCILPLYQPYTPNTRISSYKILISLLLSYTPFYTQKQACQYLGISKLFSSYLCSFLLRLSISDKQKIISFSYIISTIFFSSG